MIPLTLTSEILQEAKNILEPPAPPVSPIKTIREAKLRTLMSISGTISEEEETKNIFVSGQETKLKSITVIDTKDSVKITLWRNATGFPITLGTYVKMTHLTVHEFNNEKMLNTTQNTHIEMISIQEIKMGKQDESKPFQKAIRANIVTCSPKTNYKNAKKEDKTLYHLALADESGFIKTTCYNDDFYN
ncbi:uncharacterized protein LOC144826331 [Lissotriton helveticus]